jgi:hypothetical protein
MSNAEDKRRRELDPTLYALEDDERTFIKQLTKIEDDEELKNHILTVQREAFAVRIRTSTFSG